MADGKLVFPVTFDIAAGVKEAEKDTEGFLNRMDSILKNRPITFNAEVKGFDELGDSLKSLNENLVRLNTLMSTMGHVTVVAQEQATQSIQEHGRVTADTTNTIQRQLMVQERVNKSLRDTYNEQEHVARLISKYHDTYEDQVASLVRLNQQLATNKKAQSDNAKALKDGSVTQAEYNERQLELVAQQRQLSQAKSELTQIMRAEEKAMMVAEGSYEQLSQQLSLLKRAYKELSEEGRTSPFGQELETAIQNLDANLKDMAADIGEFQRNVGNYAIAGQNGVVATESLTAALNQEAKTTQDLVDQSKILEEAKRLLNRKDANYEATISQINAKLEENRRKLADVSDILGKDAKTVAEAEAQNKRLSEALKQVDLTSAGAKKKLEEIRAQMERNNQTIATATGANEKYADSLLKLVGVNANLGSSLQTLGQGGNFIDGLKVKTEAFAKTLMGLLSNPWVLTFLGIAGVGAAFKWWYEYNKGLIEASRLTENFTGLTGQAADKATANMQALADKMGKGYRETINAANVLVQQFGVSWKDAMDLMQDGITAGADMSGNMLSNIERFAPALRDAGVTADEFMSILAETRNGIFSEHGIQLAMRGGTRLRAMTKQIAASLDAVGISSKQMQKDLSDGTMTMFQAVQKVAAKLKELPENSQEAGNIMKHVFGRIAAEGGTLLIQSIADVNTNLNEAKESMGELGKVNEAQMNAQKELNEALMAVFKMSGTSFEKMTTRAKTFVTQGLTMIIRGLSDIANWFIRIYNNSMIVRMAINSQIAAFENVWAVAKYTLKNIIDAFKSVGKIIEGVVTLDANKIGEGWKEGMAAIGNNALNFAKKIASNTAKAYNNTLKGELKEISKLLPDEGLDETKPKTIPTQKGITPITEGDKSAAKSYLQTLNKIEQSLSTINTKYNELAKKEGNAKALEHINELYKTQLAYINQLGRQFGLSFKMPTSFKDIQDYRKAILDIMNKLKGLGVKGADTAALELEMKIGLGNVDKESKNIEAELKKLADRISRTKTAKEFYDKILSQTGDIDLAMQATVSVYGINQFEVFEDELAQLKEWFVDIDISGAINSDLKQIDYSKLREIWETDKALPEKLRKIPEEFDSSIKSLIENGEKHSRKQYERWSKDLEKAKQYADKRIEIASYTAKTIQELQDKIAMLDAGNPNYSVAKAKYESMIEDYREREKNENAKLDYEQIKEQIGMFDDLGILLSQSFDNILRQLKEYTQSPEFARLGLEAQKNVFTQIQKIEERMEQGFQGIAPKTVSNMVREYSVAASQYLSAQKELKDATLASIEVDKRLAEAKAKGDEAAEKTLLTEKQLADARINTATATYNQAGASLQRAQMNAQQATNKFEGNIERAHTAISNMLTLDKGTLKKLWDLLGTKSQDKIGQFLAGTLKAVNAVDKLNKVLADSDSTISDLSTQIASTLGDLASSIDFSQVEEATKQVTDIISKQLAQVGLDAAQSQLIAQSIGDSIAKMMQSGATQDAIASGTEGLIKALGEGGQKSGNLWGAIIGLILQLLDEFAENGIGEFIKQLLENVGDAVNGILSELLETTIPNILKGIGDLVKNVAYGIVNLLTFSAFDLGGRNAEKKANKIIENQQELLEQLEYTYSRLEKAADKMFGTDYIANFKQQKKILEAQQEAYLKMAEAEKKKGKKTDQAKVDESLQNARDIADQIADMEGQLAEHILGTDVASAAKEFADAWLDAYLSFGNTADAIKDKFNDMIQNMIVESVLAQIVQRSLKPIFDEIDERAQDGELSANDIVEVMSKVPQLIDQIDNGLTVGMKSLESLGLDLSSMREDASEYKGIAKNVAGATSEEINALAAGINTQNYYMRGIPSIASDVAQIAVLMRSGTQMPTNTSPGVDFAAFHAGNLTQLGMLNDHAARILSECQRSASAAGEMAREARNIAEKLNRVVTCQGGNFVVNTALKG